MFGTITFDVFALVDHMDTLHVTGTVVISSISIIVV